MRGRQDRPSQAEWNRERSRQGLTEEGRVQRRAGIASKAARLARDPVAGAYLFGELAWLLETRGELHNLAQVADAAEHYAKEQADLNAAGPAEPEPGPEPEPAEADHEAA